MDRRNFLQLSGLAAGGLTVKGLCLPDDLRAKEIYPERKITWIVPVKPGGGFDSLARFLSPHVVGALKELRPAARGGDLVLKNVPEAGGRRAYTNVFNAPPDGYTFGDFNLGFVTENITSKPILFGTLFA